MWNDMENMEERQIEMWNDKPLKAFSSKLNSEKIWKIWKKPKLNSETIWKIQKKIVKWYGKYGWKLTWTVKWYGKYRRNASWIVKRYGKCARNVGWIVKW
jgi:hypothetical protein